MTVPDNSQLPHVQPVPLSKWETVTRRIRVGTAGYPPQFWLLFCGMLINTAGASMIWPFLTIYMRKQFDIPLTAVTLIFTLNSITGLVTTMIAGPLIDRFGRKGAMVLSLLVNGLAFLAMSQVDALLWWIALMVIRGGANPLYRVGSNAMVADMVAPEQRVSAYALLRMAVNTGVSIGPAIGGFITSVSYTRAFYIAGGTGILYAVLVAFFIRETVVREVSEDPLTKTDRGYGPLLRDRSFLAFCGVYVLVPACATLMMVLLSVYAKENFGVPENQYGFIMSTNAAMVVLFQFVTTWVTKRYSSFRVLAVGALFYGLGVGSVAWGASFQAFLVSMVVMTVGELIVMPTATTLVANLAPPDMRGRYMGVYSLTWGIGFGIGPVLGGLLNDYVAPVAIWYGGLVMGSAAGLGFLLMAHRMQNRLQASENSV